MGKLSHLECTNFSSVHVKQRNRPTKTFVVYADKKLECVYIYIYNLPPPPHPTQFICGRYNDYGRVSYNKTDYKMLSRLTFKTGIYGGGWGDGGEGVVDRTLFRMQFRWSHDLNIKLAHDVHAHQIWLQTVQQFRKWWTSNFFRILNLNGYLDHEKKKKKEEKKASYITFNCMILYHHTKFLQKVQ